MTGLFYLCGGVAALALLSAACRSALSGIRRHHDHSHHPERTLDHTATDGEMLRLLIEKVRGRAPFCSALLAPPGL